TPSGARSPRRPPPRAQRHRHEHRRALAAGSARRRGGGSAMTSVLVVDDDQQLVSAISRDLRANGYDVLSASSVDGALEQLTEKPSDVVLTDLRMAEADGIDLLLAIRERGLSSRPILMSAYATARDHQKAVELGAVRVLCKPFGSRELLDAIQQAIDCATGFRGSVHGLS